MAANNSKTKFSDKVEDYIKYRPTYPKEMITILQKELNLNSTNIIADIGSGTGISSLPFLDNGNKVYAIEPNLEMRKASENILNIYPNFTAIDGSAEETTLQDKSIDTIFCGQAFHWFDKKSALKEFDRILKDNGHIILAWNSRSTKSDFQKEYEKVLSENIADYKFTDQININNTHIQEIFKPKEMKIFQIENNKQTFNLEGLKGRLKSSSYCPKSGVIYDKLMKLIESVFLKYEKNDIIEFEYDTEIYFY